MKIFLALFLSVLPCLSAVRTKFGGDNKTTIRSPARQAELFSQLTNTSSLTIAFWLKYDLTDAQVNANLGAGNFQGLVSKGFFDTFGMQLGMSSASEKIGFSYSNPAGTFHEWRSTSTSVQTNTWMHIATTYTYGTGSSMKLYINGISTVGSWVAGDGNSGGLTNATSFHTFLYQKGAGSSFFIGAMSDLAIWTNSLTAGEISKLALSKVKYMPIQIRPAELLFFWPMDTFPEATAVPNQNVDDDRTYSSFHLDTGGLFKGEKTLSYQPNE